MKLMINGEEKSYSAPLTVMGLVGKHGLKKEGVAVELNKKIVKKVDYENTLLKDGDKVELVHFVGGG
ncbi:MAG: thiamine biosynthesis protein ThiS [Candidatus Firestonebacteria bacterium RIFOXYA2_FULL_40_8]|nr:MAG: thiamine biosynthesis protein ThiS [Candidatus Firestonebacteria bacterium RIFOXYA2_FULL_40_8]